MNFQSWAFTVVSLCVTGAAHTKLNAQIGSQPLPVDSILARFEREARTHDGAGRAAHWIVMTFASRPARRDSLLDGLERLADGSPNKDVRAFAAQMVASAGEAANESPPVPGILRRLERIYARHRAYEDYGARLLIVSSLPLQGERAAAAALLRSIASEPDPGNNGMGPHGYFSVGDLRIEALSGLAKMGEEGRAVLQSMYRSRETMSPQARIVLERMAQRGFPVTDAVERMREANRRAIVQP